MNGKQQALIEQLAEWFADESKVSNLENIMSRFSLSEADEIVHSTYVKAYNFLTENPASPFENSMDAWIYAIAKNAALDHLKHKSAISRLQGTVTDEFYSGSGQTILDSVAEGIERENLMRVVNEALDKLPKHQRAAIVLHHLEGKSYEETAELLGISSNNVGVKIHRGMQMLRRLVYSSPEGSQYRSEMAA